MGCPRNQERFPWCPLQLALFSEMTNYCTCRSSFHIGPWEARWSHIFMKTFQVGSARWLPCPRYYGACSNMSDRTLVFIFKMCVLIANFLDSDAYGSLIYVVGSHLSYYIFRLRRVVLGKISEMHSLSC